MDIIKTIKEEIQLFEVRHIQPYKDINNNIPLKDNETIVVYHGFSNVNEGLMAAKFGVTGKERARRQYSYESGNNPKGLFVTIEFFFAKQFGHGGVIVEFSTKVSDLEAPVWASDAGGYFVQGQMTKSFKSDEEREARRLKNREEFAKNEYDAISQSDRPELAYWLYEGAEKQALFTGDLNPNMIKAFWVNNELIVNNRTGDEWVRMNRNEFYNKYEDRLKSKILVSRAGGSEFKDEYPESYYDKKQKIFKPADDFSADALKSYLDNEGYNYEDFVDTYIKHWDNHIMHTSFYPKQIQQIKKIYGVDDIKENLDKIINELQTI